MNTFPLRKGARGRDYKYSLVSVEVMLKDYY